MLKLSVIVPVYNVAPYLRKCVDSLLTQDLAAEEYEIILVDDGSTDGSGQICDELANKPSIRVIHQANGGLSAARNAGLAVAEGKYVQFVDSDDYLEPNILGGLIAQCERENLDVLRFDYQNVRLLDAEHFEYEVFEPNKYPHQVDKRTDVTDGETYLNERMGYACYAVMFIIRRELFNDDLRFAEGIYFEDTEWTPRMLIAAKRVNTTQKVVYNYLTRAGSITKEYTKEHIRKKIDALMQVNLSLQCISEKVKDNRWIKGCIADNVHGMLNNIAAYDYESAQYRIDVIKKNNMLPLRGYKVRKMTSFRYAMINLSPRLYCWFRHIRMTCL